ncbi:GntR family transcriptional regulator [Polymorphum gilvum]|uniref:Regulatory protein GntR, HTH:UbiC transcription regulator-associated n=1 Tax=Polymorphum gilvum (strain LMG 25793 / CGMCC 1.9160 / SL003B-26A1) TaxID=991905 RepID=F2J4K7_POLGS|nr:GntR family transcriptional regulator [Polymorphum gilvum]ADZ72259.1 Regulatory protein GntR, HTH:UbiC transcription regulator-associated [Polymorphum gilvum SL003B-26A1]
MNADTGQEREADAQAARSHGRLNPSGRVPLYHQIFLILRNRIYGGELSAGDLVPSELDLTTEFGVSRITAKRALNELADAGLVIRERGRGTRVVKRPPAPAVTSSIEGWLENISLMGLSTEAQVLDFGYVPASEDIAHALEIDAGTDVQRAVRVRRLDGEPMSFLVTYVPADIGRQFDRDDLNVKPLLHLLEMAGVDVASARQTISATLADAEVAGALSIHAGAPLIEVRRVVRDRSGRPVEYIRVLYRPDLYHFEMSMRRVREQDGPRWATTSPPPVPAGGG